MTEDKDDDEVFFGPVGFRERCVKTVVSSAHKDTKPLSPLNEQEMELIFQEANAVAERMASAYTDKKSKPKQKGNILCAKQLNLGENVFKKEAIVSLLKATSSNHRLSDEENKENCDTVDCGDSVAIEVDELEEVKKLKQKLNININSEDLVLDCDILNKREQPVKKKASVRRVAQDKSNLLIDLGDDYMQDSVMDSPLRLSESEDNYNNEDTSTRKTRYLMIMNLWFIFSK